MHQRRQQPAHHDGRQWALDIGRDNMGLSSWMTVKELAEELRFPSEDAARSWLRREQIPSVRRGRVILIDRLDIDAALRKVD